MTGSILGVANATAWYTGRDVNTGGVNGLRTLSSDIYSDAGITLAANGSKVAQWNDASGAGNNATQTTSGSQPIFAAYGGMDGSNQPGVQFDGGATTLIMPAGVTMGNGSPTNEGTLIVGGYVVTGGQAATPNIAGGGFPVGLGGRGLWWGNGSAPAYYTGSENNFNIPNPLPTTHPFVYGLRFSSAGSKFYYGTKYIDTLATNFGASLSGGYMGSLSNNFFFQGVLNEVMIFNQAVSDANMQFLLQEASDRICPEYSTLNSQICFFGDSRTRGYDSTIAFGFGSNRSWPARCLRKLGGGVKATQFAYVGDTVAQQITRITAGIGVNNTLWGKNIWIGELGINDITAGTAAATIYAGLVSLWSYILANGGTQVIALTVGPSAANTTAQNTQLAALNVLIKSTNMANVTICDNASDPRLKLAGYPDYDNLHWLDAGLAVYAENVTPIVQTLLGISTGGAGISISPFLK